MRKEKGFTMIEVVTALALLALMVIPLATLLTQGYFHYQRAGRRTQETARAAAFLEELAALGYSEVKEGFLCWENAPTEEYSYISGRNNYCQGPVGPVGPVSEGSEAGEGGEVTFRLHLLMEPFLLNQEPLQLEVLLVEVWDSRENLLLATYLSGWRK